MKSIAKSLLLLSSLVISSSMVMAHVQVITKSQDLNDVLTQDEASNKLTVVYYYQEHCGPCKSFGPKFDGLSKKHSDVDFVKVDVSKKAVESISRTIKFTPTVRVFKSKKQVEEVDGDVQNVEKAIKKHNK